VRARTGEFRTSAQNAVADKRLRRTLKQAAAHFKDKRDAAFADFKQAGQYRDLARRIKQHAIANLPALLRKLETRVQDAGGHVHWAADAAEAREIVTGIAQNRGVAAVVKGKSMVTEEIGLNRALEDRGIEVLETDLGEYIVQLAGEPPSHIIAPAVHKNRRDVAKLFAEKLNIEPVEEIEELTLVARRVLRQRFLAADMGVTGANMLVAETGTLVLVENEGNIRMSTTCPRIHVAVAGIEKVVDTLDQAAALLNILPRSATGQKLSTYVSFITGPRRPGESDGPEEFHLVLLDNGRSRIAADEKMRSSLYCIRCGACLNVCPVYRAVGGHAYGWAYCGPIGAVLAPQMLGLPRAEDLVFACTMCGACSEICPVKLDHPKLLTELRHRAYKHPACREGKSSGSRAASRAFELAATHPKLWRGAALAARTLDPRLKISTRLPGFGPVRRWTVSRTLPRMCKPFSKRWRKLEKQLISPGGPDE